MAVISLPTDVHNFIEQALTDLLSTDIFGQNCLLYMPPLPESCVNCVADPIGMKSSNLYLNGGPMPFENGQLCPMCRGDYTISRQMTIPVVFSIEYKFDSFLDILKRIVRHPESTIQTRGLTSDINNMVNCSYMETRLEIGNIHYIYKLLGEPIIPGRLSNKFCYAVWERS